MPRLRLDELDLHYLDAGPAGAPEVVLLLHAFPLHAAMWRPQIDALAGRYRVLAPDLRGFGGTPVGAGPSTMAGLAGDVRALLGHLGVANAAVVGLSMGGYVAFELLRQAPELVRALVLADTRAGADDPAGRAGREAFAESALTHGLGWVAEAMVPRLLREPAEPALAGLVRGLIGGGTPAGVAAAQRGMAQRPRVALDAGGDRVPDPGDRRRARSPHAARRGRADGRRDRRRAARAARRRGAPRQPRGARRLQSGAPRIPGGAAGRRRGVVRAARARRSDPPIVGLGAIVVTVDY